MSELNFYLSRTISGQWFWRSLAFKSPWIFFSFECSGLKKCCLMLFDCPRQNIKWSLHSAQVSRHSICCPWPLKLMMSQVVERMWICTDGYGRLRANGLKKLLKLSIFFQAQYRYAQAFYELGDITRAKETNRAARKICSEKKDLEGQFERFEKGFQASELCWSIIHKVLHVSY